MSLSPELKGCPFCGSPAARSTFVTESLWSHDEVEWLSIGCSGDCDFSMQSEVHDDLEARWNARAEASPLPPVGWEPISEVRDCFPVLVSRAESGMHYVPTTAFKDVGGTWRVFRSEDGNWPLSFDPTHWMPLPEPPPAALPAEPASAAASSKTPSKEKR